MRSAEKAVSPLSWFLDLPIGAVVEELITCFGDHNQATVGRLTDDELTAARELAARKYETAAWIDRL